MKTEPQTPDNSCPHCGAEETNSSGLRIYWACGSHATFGCDMKPTPLCREREAHNKTKAELENERERVQNLCCIAERAIETLGDQYFCHESYHWKPNSRKLKLRAELEALNTTDK